MGYYATTCSTCGGPAIFFSFSMSIDCGSCGRRYDFLNLLVAWRLKVAGDEAAMLSTVMSVEQRTLGPMTLALPESD